MAPSSSPAFSSPALSSYAPPTALADLHILDFLELAGSQAKAGMALSMHQSTVSRSAQLMRAQFRLMPRQGSSVCRHGHNPCLQFLRLASREHRLMEGLLRIGTDLLHQRLLQNLAGVQLVPPRFRSAGNWAELVRNGLLDGALLSSFGLEGRLLAGQLPQWEGLVVLPLGQLRLLLVAPVATVATGRRVLLPRRAAAPLLHRAVAAQGYGVEQQPAACQELEAWIKRARDRQLALPICPELLEPSWVERHGLMPLADQPLLEEQLWLLLPEGATNGSAARGAVRGLLQQLRIAETMQDPHETQL
ncbi:hypothetical protein KBZ14_06050 [Synechococcus sp. HJ21-Hayes]|uniref:hypothetical protein n=1 Tax=unclassified Synechococcus TaxID=2626047 RepID=UPI0020CEAB21|nr:MULTISPECIES: hypothetical protein [unclassified Synechococcus]MCP9831869.1 hypothetical protein [Synechococcus sp. JJ3a-Johnson]MCP9852432.1 hypothetical protein [Synechococcus sp. HJ21-Hayes]